MIVFRETYDSRKKEIEEFIELMEFLERKENDWCFERYNCPRYTTPDENGNVILDYAVSIVG